MEEAGNPRWGLARGANNRELPHQSTRQRRGLGRAFSQLPFSTVFYTDGPGQFREEEEEWRDGHVLVRVLAKDVLDDHDGFLDHVVDLGLDEVKQRAHTALCRLLCGKRGMWMRPCGHPSGTTGDGVSVTVAHREG